jgi:hypothetical protein
MLKTGRAAKGMPKTGRVAKRAQKGVTKTGVSAKGAANWNTGVMETAQGFHLAFQQDLYARRPWFLLPYMCAR